MSITKITTITTMTMTNKKPVFRRCSFDGSIHDRSEMFRVVKTKSGHILIQKDTHIDGRGAYLLKDIEVISKAKKSRALSRTLRCKVEDSVYEELLNLLS